MKTIPRKYTFTFEIENVRILIVLFGDFFYKQDMHSTTHSHNSFEFHIISDGVSQIYSNESNNCIMAHKACIISPNTIHTWVSQSKATIKTSFCFSYEKTNKKTAKDVFKTFDCAFGNIKDIKVIEDAEKYVDEIEHIMSVCQNAGGLASIKLRLCFSLFMLELADDLLKESKNNIDESEITNELAEKNLRRIIIEDYINQYYNTPISIDSLSKVLHLSRKQTERIFMQEMKMSFKSFIINLRLESAIHYLKQTKLSVSEIAQKVGYNSYNGFYRLFMSRFGITPQMYREKFNNKPDK